MPGGFPLGFEVCNVSDNGTDTANTQGAAVANSGTAGVYGSYVQLVASTAFDSCWMTVVIHNTVTATSKTLSFNVAVGGAGSEINIVSDLTLACAGGGGQSKMYSFPCSIPAGTRISANCQGGTTGVDTGNVEVYLHEGAFQMMEGAAGIESIGFTGSFGTTITAAGSANTKGSYAQLTASTSRDYMGIMAALDNLDTAVGVTNNVRHLIDIAIGGSGSEIPIIPNWVCIDDNFGNQVFPFTPIGIPAGTRLAARMQSTTASLTRGLTLYGVYQ